MSKKLCPKIILEGTRLTFKTEIAFALNEHPRIVGPRKYRYHSPVISAEWCGFANFPWGRGLINFEPHEEEKAMETYRTWAHLFELLQYYSLILDRFFLSTQMYQLKYNSQKYDFKWLEEKLLTLGFHQVFFTRSLESFESARAKRLKVSGKPSQYDNIQQFIDEQNLFKELISKSILPTLELDISDNNIKETVEKSADWLSDTGGLWAK